MRIGPIDATKRVCVIAEIGNNHEGNVDLAEEMIGLAADAGADAVKFQTFRTEHYVSKQDAARVEMLSRFELTPDEFARLRNVADGAGVQFISTPFDLLSVDALESLVAVYKVASGDNTFYPLLEKIAATGKSVILSSGMAQIPQLKFAKGLLDNVWAENGVQAELGILHCVTSYPVPPEEANLGMIDVLRREIGGTVGYSDHTMGITCAVAAVACGARIVEKHFTSDKNFSDFRDHQLSADPVELGEMVQRIREMEILLGPGQDELLECESSIRPAVRRSIVAARDLPAGHVLGLEDITWVRPAGGIAPGKERLVLGKRLIAPISHGEMVLSENLASGGGDA